MTSSCDTCAFYFEEGFDPQFVKPHCMIIERLVGGDGDIEQLMEKFNGHCPFYLDRGKTLGNVTDEDVTKRIIEIVGRC